MDLPLFKELLNRELISEAEFKRLQKKNMAPLSVHWDIKTLLYLGIVLFTTAVAILIYKNIDTIGHQAMLIIIAAACVISFGYCIKHSTGYSNLKIESNNTWLDYVLLTGCLLLLTFAGYGQYQYNIFGNRWGLALFIPMVILFIAAYYFDNLGVLSLAVTNLAAWAGISITPVKILKENDFNNTHIMYTGLLLGIILMAISFATQYKDIKAHFAFTYKNFGAHILFISLLALLFYFDNIYLVWFMILGVVVFLFFKNAVKEKSLYFMVVTVLYAYIALSYVIVKLLLIRGFGMSGVYLVIFYFIVSGIGLIRLFIHYNKIINKNAGL